MRQAFMASLAAVVYQCKCHFFFLNSSIDINYINICIVIKYRKYSNDLDEKEHKSLILRAPLNRR